MAEVTQEKLMRDDLNIAPKRNPEFAVHRLNAQGIKKAEYIQNTFDFCLNTLSTICQDGRSFSLTRTHLEQACFNAKKAMAMNPENQEVTT